MNKKLDIVTENYGEDFKRGEIKIISQDGAEAFLKVELNFVISTEEIDLEDLKEEIQNLIERYAI